MDIGNQVDEWVRLGGMAITGLGMAYASKLSAFEAGRSFLRFLPAAIGIFLFGATVAIAEVVIHDIVLIGIVGGVSALIGIFLPKSAGQLTEDQLISVSSRSSTFGNAFGPPMEAGGRADEIGPLLEGGASLELGVFQVLDRGEVLVDQRGVGQRPQVLSGLQFRRIRRQEE